MSSSHQPGYNALPDGIEFRDTAAASRNWNRIRQLIPGNAAEALLQLLAALPDADSVVSQFAHLVANSPAEILHLLGEQRALIHHAVLVFVHSPWLGETLIRNPDLLRSGNLRGGPSREDLQQSLAKFREATSADGTATCLARFKRHEYIGILLRDLLEIATLAETTSEISTLADVLIEEAVREVYADLRRRYDDKLPSNSEETWRMHSGFAVLSLGKLGGNELNYSSDIDLLFLYDDAALGGSGSREFFIRLAQRTTELLSRPTSDGPVFRIDLRLRPQGNEGDPAVPLSYAIRYYSQVAHDWELQAMIKARHSAGDAELTRRFIRSIEPYVYRPEINFAAIKTALVSLERIGKRHKQRQSTSRERGIDVKLDRGGIRDIEFLVQCLQRVYGGPESWLRSRGTLFALQKLHDKGHIDGGDFQDLTSAYEFLRKVEHRLQLRYGRQLHHLPVLRSDLLWLAFSVARNGGTVPNGEQFLADVNARMSAVAAIYQRIIFREQADHTEMSVTEIQIGVATEIPRGQQWLAYESSELREIVGRQDLSQHARRNLNRFLISAHTTSERYGAVRQSPEAVRNALSIFEYSDFLTDILVQYPTEVSVLEQLTHRPQATAVSPSLFPEVALNGAIAHTDASDAVFAYLVRQPVDNRQAVALLRQAYRRSVLLSGARDLFHHRDVFDSLADNTAAADAAIRAALAISQAPAGFAAMGLGRLGSREFDLLSDADLLFVRDETADPAEMQQVAERVMEALAAYTRDGAVFPVDARLRPHGREGELVVTPTQLSAYFAADAQPWEALTYLKLRHIAGDAELANRTLDEARRGITTVAGRAEFAVQLAAMRTRLEQSETSPTFKKATGGIYDIDYVLGAFQLRHNLWSTGNLPHRIALVRQRDLITHEEQKELSRSACVLRTVEHVVRLVTGASGKWLPLGEHAHGAVEKLMAQMLGSDEGSDTASRLGQARQQARSIYLKYHGD